MAYVLNSGFWSVGMSNCFFDKGEAFRYATRTNSSNIKFHFFDEVYGTVDWSKEPQQTLDQLYAYRAQELRDQYDYIALSFSGGADSSNVLRTFLKNKIKLDEVVVWYPVEATEKMLNKFNPDDKSAGNVIYEYYYACLPVLKWLAAHHPEIKITVLDYTNASFEMIGKGELHAARIGGSVQHAMTIGQYMMTDHLRKLKKNVCQLLAIDKPKVRYLTRTKTMECYFHDFNTLMGHWAPDVFNKTEPKTEYFYYTPTMPQIVVKQCHEIKRGIQQELRIQVNHHATSPSTHYITIDPHTNLIKKIIYPDWDTSIYQARKALRFFYHENTQWFIDITKDDKRMVDYFEGQLADMKSGVRPDLFVYEGNRAIRFKDLYTHGYTF
jgi:hypothetical protein